MSEKPNQLSREVDTTAPLGPPPPAASVPVLQKLSSPPFPRSGFPLLGILASAYEHVTAVAARMGSPRKERGAGDHQPHA